MRIEDPSTGRVLEQRVAAVCGIEAAAERIGSQPVLFCMRSPDTAAAARALAAVAPQATVASLQNDVDNEDRARGELRARDRRLRAADEHAHGRQLPPCAWETAAS